MPDLDFKRPSGLLRVVLSLRVAVTFLHSSGLKPAYFLGFLGISLPTFGFALALFLLDLPSSRLSQPLAPPDLGQKLNASGP
jgi:hypothetical protein